MNEAASKNLSLTIEQKQPKDFAPKLASVRDKASNLDRTKDKGLVNENGGRASVSVRENKINTAASPQANSKVDGNSNQIINISYEEKSITNRRSLELDELSINGHKINTNLWEYTDFKVYKDQLGNSHIVGNFCLNGTVLVRAWDHQLGRYMLIRRPARLPMFSNLLNVPEIDESLNIADPSKLVKDYPAKQSTQSASDWYKEVLKYKQAQDKKTAEEDNINVSEQ